MEDNRRLDALRSIEKLCLKSQNLRHAGRLTEAKAALNSALVLYRSSAEPDPQVYAAVLDEIGHVSFCRAEYSEAEMHYYQAIQVLEQALYPEHADVAMILDHLCRLFIIQERYKEAEPLCERALAIKQKCLLAQDCQTLESMRMTAIVKICLGKFDEAEKLLDRAIDILEPTTIGPVEEFVRLMARVYEGQGKKAEAEEFYRRAVRVFKSRHGQQSGLAQCELDHARLLDELGKAGDAERARRLARVAESFRKRKDDLPETSVYQPLSYPATIFH